MDGKVEMSFDDLSEQGVNYRLYLSNAVWLKLWHEIERECRGVGDPRDAVALLLLSRVERLLHD